MNPALSRQLAVADAAMKETGESQGAVAPTAKAPPAPAEGPPPPVAAAPVQAEGAPATSAKGEGKKGRPEIDYLEVADKFAEWLGAPPRHYRGEWWVYAKERAYILQSEKELQGRFAAFADAKAVKLTVNLRRNVFEALLKHFVEGEKTMPRWLDSGQSARGWAAMQNGLLDIEEAARNPLGVQLLPHSPDFFGSYSFPFAWDPNARAPLFAAYLEGVQPDEESRRVLLKLLGLLLVPDTSFQCCFILYGEAGCGKSVFIQVAQALLGRKNVCSIPLAMFAEKFATVDLSRCLANLVDDSPTVDGRTTLATVEGVLKDVTCGGDVWCELKGVQGRSYPATARCVFCQNPPLPVFADRSNGIWRRLRIIPFCQPFDNSPERNPKLAEDIIAHELPGVFVMALRGLGWLRDENADGHFPETPEGARLLEEHRAACDKEAAFLRDKCREDALRSVSSESLYGDYKAWCNENGYSRGCKNAANFAADVRRVFPNVILKRVRIGSGKRETRWEGLAMQDPMDDDEPDLL